MPGWSEVDFGIGFTVSQVPGALLSSDLNVAKVYPAVDFTPQEGSAQYHEIREVAGDLYVVKNATFDGTNWNRSNIAVAAYGERLLASGKWQRIYVAAGANPITWAVLAEISELGSLTVTEQAFTTDIKALSLSPTWNATGVVMRGILLNVTDTASAAASLLLDLQKAGASQFNVDKSGNVTALGALALTGAATLGAGITTAGPVLFSTDNAADLGASGATRPRSGYFGTALIIGTTPATVGLVRLAAASAAPVLEQRNAGNTADLQIAGYNASNVLQVGDAANAGLQFFTNGAQYDFSSNLPVRTNAANRFRMLQSMGQTALSAAQSIPDSISTAISWTSASVNTDGMWAGGSPTRLTAPITGKYLLGGQGEWAANATGRRSIGIRKNGTTVLISSDFVGTLTAVEWSQPVSSGVSVLTAGDYIEMVVTQTSGVGLNFGQTPSQVFMFMLYVGE